MDEKNNEFVVFKGKFANKFTQMKLNGRSQLLMSKIEEWINDNIDTLYSSSKYSGYHLK